MLRKILKFFNRYSIGRNESVRDTEMLVEELKLAQTTNSGWFKFRKNLGHGTPVRDLPTRIPTKEELEPIKEKLTKLAKKTPIKIAIDQSVGAAMASKIHAKGYEIVCKAGNAESDEAWIRRALANKALFVVSPDLDIPSMIEKENLPMVWIDFLFAAQLDPQINTRERDVKRELWARHVHERIQAKLKFFRSEFCK